MRKNNILSVAAVMSFVASSMVAFMASFTIAPAAQAQTAAKAAQPWPQHPVTLIVPAAPGGATDTLTRVLAEGLSAQLGQTVVVENRSGAAGTVGLQAALRAPADGYTYVIAYPSVVINSQFTVKDLPFNVKRDFQAVAGIASTELVMSVNASVPARDPQELIAWLKNQTGSNLAYGSYGEGSYAHCIAYYMGDLYGIDAVHAPYKGEQQMMLAMAGNDIAYGVTSLSAGKAMQDTGKTRMVGLLSANRSTLRPEIPTFKESGIADPEFQLLAWFGVFASKDVPAPIVRQMETAVLKVLADPKVQERLTALSMPVWGASAQELDKTWSSEIPIYEKLLRLAKVQMY